MLHSYNKEGLEPLTWGTWTPDLRDVNPWLEGLEPLTGGTWTLDLIGLEGLEPSILSIHAIRRDSNPRSCSFIPSGGTWTLGYKILLIVSGGTRTIDPRSVTIVTQIKPSSASVKLLTLALKVWLAPAEAVSVMEILKIAGMSRNAWQVCTLPRTAKVPFWISRTHPCPWRKSRPITAGASTAATTISCWMK